MLADQAHAFVDQLANVLELAGMAIILGSIVLARATFIRCGSRTGDSAFPFRNRARHLSWTDLLVGAGPRPSRPLLPLIAGLLAALVAIRKFLSFSMETEIEGCRPSQRAAKGSVRGE